MSIGSRLETETVMLVAASVAVLLLVGVGVLQLSIDGDTGAFARNLGVAALLLLFTGGYYWQWHRESVRGD